MSDLVEKCKLLVAEELRLLDLIEDFKKKKKTILRDVQEQIKVTSDDELVKVEAELQKVTIDIKVEESKTKRRCRYFNRGYCKVGSNCEFDHSQGDCERHLGGEHCRERDCEKRHRKVCKYWDSKESCFRGSKCQYLHEYIEQKREKVIQESLEKCDACNFDNYEKDQVVKHIIKGREFQICLQCNHVIKNKNILVSKKLDMREIYRKDIEAEGGKISDKELDRLVKK